MLVSIITVNFNHLEGLKRTYESVVNQTFGDYEWIVIDGGSTDGSREFIEQHQDRFAYWCSEKDNGIYHAMNKGIRQAKGEYLNFMNTGDIFVSNETLAKVFSERRTADILYGYTILKNSGNKCGNLGMMKRLFHWYDFFYNTLPHQSTFIRREAFERIGLYDETCRIVADWIWFVRAIFHCNASYEFIPQKIAIYEGGGISATKANMEEKRARKEQLFPNYLSEQDAILLRRASLVHSYKLTAFLFRVVYRIAWEFDKRQRAAELRKLSEHFN